MIMNILMEMRMAICSIISIMPRYFMIMMNNGHPRHEPQDIELVILTITLMIMRMIIIFLIMRMIILTTNRLRMENLDSKLWWTATSTQCSAWPGQCFPPWCQEGRELWSTWVPSLPIVVLSYLSTRAAKPLSSSSPATLRLFSFLLPRNNCAMHSFSISFPLDGVQRPGYHYDVCGPLLRRVQHVEDQEGLPHHPDRHHLRRLRPRSARHHHLHLRLLGPWLGGFWLKVAPPKRHVWLYLIFFSVFLARWLPWSLIMFWNL